MYFPYLYGRRFELLALRSASTEFPLAETIAPVIEPVVERPADLKRCLQALGARRVRAVVILIPHQGHFREHSPAALPGPSPKISHSTGRCYLDFSATSVFACMT